MAGSKKSEKQLEESKEGQLAPSCAATHHGHWTVQIFFGQFFLHFAIFLLQIQHLCQMESVKDERMKALWRPFCAGEVRRDKPGTTTTTTNAVNAARASSAAALPP